MVKGWVVFVIGIVMVLVVVLGLVLIGGFGYVCKQQCDVQWEQDLMFMVGWVDCFVIVEGVLFVMFLDLL